MKNEKSMIKREFLFESSNVDIDNDIFNISDFPKIKRLELSLDKCFYFGIRFRVSLNACIDGDLMPS